MLGCEGRSHMRFHIHGHGARLLLKSALRCGGQSWRIYSDKISNDHSLRMS